MNNLVVIHCLKTQKNKILNRLYYLLIISIWLTSCDYKSSNEIANIENINIGEEIYAGNQSYDADDYKKAIYHYLRAYNAGKVDGIITYRIAYSAEQLQGLTDNVKNAYLYALDLLSKQYPNHKYNTYAQNKVRQFSKNDYTNYGIAENGDFFNSDNDGDGRLEQVYVSGYFNKDGTYVRSHYRAKPR